MVSANFLHAMLFLLQSQNLLTLEYLLLFFWCITNFQAEITRRKQITFMLFKCKYRKYHKQFSDKKK